MKPPRPSGPRRPRPTPNARKPRPKPDAAHTETPLGEGLDARRAALDLVAAALDHRGGLEEALVRKPFAGLELRDRALARMTAMTLLRRLGAIDRLLDAKLAKPPPEAVRMLLRLGAAQLLFMDVPAHAAIDTTVRLAGAAEATRPFKGLVNAVLRGLQRDGAPDADPEVLAPGWLFARWRAAYGEADARAMAAVIAEEPLTDLSLRQAEGAGELAEALEAEVLPGGSLRSQKRGDVADWPGYAEGRWWVQDAAAAIPARLLAIQPGETAIDLCAAPGGKTLQLAAAGAKVTALDRSAQRLRRLTQALERTGLTAEVVAAEAERWEDSRRFDAVLLDAPCSATGTFRRHPDVLWGTRPGDIAKLAGVQARLMDSAAERVKPGGRLVYCVCSLETEEAEAQAEAFLARHEDFALAPVQPGEGGAPQGAVTKAGLLRVLPHQLPGGADGFFAARFVRKA
ncbi:RsmB/NOP family class I SAM-dependent RNA methyltransferase [Phenylobacterium montanum]|uniref:RsmB/NOP family class I SAM-dependent RNA methyltransferase n=1 Tax=Phenylobacterium montanum TaxID=2823693 RepID=A0A975FWX7_9CAUL|nr:RsmB/NOP family class I SAM-dependent RNA methyltransferase [Caulobacter sp. S6]QUD86661.1 RsmB/NOP family class I SAM-dependent RNA methyltransferase [Caulobacter sp. S6]